MFVLVIDTATPDLRVGLVAADANAVPGSTSAGSTSALREVARIELADCKKHNEVLIPTITQLLADAGITFADLTGIVVGTGPGPFTGLRVGMATASALAHARNIPVYGVSTHVALAQQLPKPALVLTDARRREMYWALVTDTAVIGPEVSKPAEFELPQPIVAYSAPAGFAVPEVLADYDCLPVEFRPTDWVELVDFSQPPQPLVPLYLRRPDAVEPQPVHFEYALGQAGAAEASNADEDTQPDA